MFPYWYRWQRVKSARIITLQTHTHVLKSVPAPAPAIRHGHETTPVTAIRGYPHTRRHARVPANFRKSSTHYISTADKHHLFKKINKSEQTNELISYMNT
jgi:hypothetical protein